MSNMIEKEVVKMEFDNSDFEKKTKESMSTIEKLKKALNFDTAKETLSNFAKQANELDFNGLKDSVDTIAKRFSNLGIVGMTVVSRLTNALVDGVKKISSSITGMIASGGLSRAMNIEKAKFQLEGLGIAWDDIKEDIDYGVKDTAYGLDAAASAAAQLSASGVQIGEEMKISLRAISGVAAMTGASYDEIARVFEAGAGQGRVMMGELTRLAERGVNATAVLAKALGKTEAEIREMASDSQIDFMTFAKAMDDAFGQHAKDANKTLNGTLDNIRSAWSRVGAEFIQPIIRNEGELVQLLNAYREKINDIKEAIIPVAQQTTTLLNQVIASFTRTIQGIDIKERVKKIGEGISDLINAFQKLMVRISFVGRKIGEVYRQIFPKKEAKDITASFAKITKAIKEFNFNSEQIKKIQSIFRGLFSVVKVGETLFKNLLVVVKPIFKYIVSEASNMLDIAAYMGDAISKLVDGTFKFEDAATMVSTVLENIETGLKWIKLGFKELIGDTEDTIEVMEGVSLRGLEIIQGVLHIVQGLVSAIATAVGTVFGLNTDTINSYIVSLFDKIENFFKELFWIYQEAGGGAEGFAAIFSSVIYTIGKKITEFIEKITGIDLSALKDKLVSGINDIQSKVAGFIEKIKNPLHKLGELFTFVKDRVKELTESLTGLAKSASIGLGKMLENPIGSFITVKGLGATIDTIRQWARDGHLGSLSTTLNSIRTSLTNFIATVNARTIATTAMAIVAFGVSLRMLGDAVAKLAGVENFERTLGALGEVLGLMIGVIGSVAIILQMIKSSSIDKSNVRKLVGVTESVKASLKLSAGNIIAASIMLVAIAKAVQLMAESLTDIMGMDANIEDHILAVAEIFGALVILGEALKKLASKVPKTGVQGKFFIIYAATLMLIAGAVKIMGSAFVEINKEMANIGDLDDLIHTLLAIGTVFGMLAGVVMSLNKIKIANVQNLAAIGIGVIAMAEGVKILVEAVNILKDTDPGPALMGLVVVCGLLYQVMMLAGRIGGKTISLKTSAGFLAIAAAIAILVHDIKALTELPIYKVIEGFIALVGIIGTFVYAANAFAAGAQGLAAAGFGMIEFAGAIYIVVKAIQQLKAMNPEDIAIRLGLLLTSILAFAVIADKFTIAQAAGLALLEISAGLYIIAQAIGYLGNMDVFNILKGAGSLILFLELLCVSVTKFTMAVPGAQALLLVAAALGVLAISIAVLAPLGSTIVVIGGALIGFVAVLGTVAIAFNGVSSLMISGATAIAIALGIIALGLLAVVAPVGIFAAAIGVIAVSATAAADGLKIFVETLITLTKESAANIKTMSTLTTIMVKASMALAAAGAGLLVMGAGLAVFGAGALIGAAGAAALAGGIGLLAAALTALILVLEAANLDGIVESLGLRFGANFSKSTAEGIKGAAPIVVSAISALAKKSVDEFNKETGINSPSKVFMESGKYLDMGLAEGITGNSDLVKKASEQLGTTASTSLSNSLTKGTNEGSKTLEGAVKQFATITEKGSYNAGANTGAGFMRGLNAIAPKVRAYAANLGKSAYMAMKQYLKIKSPSRLMMELGEYTGEGFVIGMQNTETNVEDSAQDLGKTASNSLTTALSAAYNNLTSGIEDPTIKPVLDLSEIQNGASSIDSMLSRDFASNISANYRSDRDYADEQTQANASLMSGLNDRLVSALMATGNSDLPINLNVQLVGDAAGVFRLVQAENQRMTNMYGSSPLMRG